MMYHGPARVERIGLQSVGTPAAEGGEEGPIALLRVMAAQVKRHRKKLFLCTGVGLVGAALYAHSLPRTYTSAATLLLEPRRQAVAFGGGANGQTNLDLNRADSELQVIRSERLLSAVFESLNLREDSELRPQAPGLVARLFGKGAATTTPSVGEGLSGGGGNAPAATSAVDIARQIAFDNFTRRVTARRIGQSYVVEIEYASSYPAMTARVANAVVSGYILQSVAFKAEVAKAGSEALQGRLDSLAAQVDAASDAMKKGTLPRIPTPDADARIIGAALTPLAASGPRSILITALGGLVGFISGLALIGFDRKVRDPGHLTRDTGVPCLGLLPPADDPNSLGRCPDRETTALAMTRPGNDFSKAVRDFRTSVEIACVPFLGDRGLVVAIAAFEPGSGASSLCLNLAQLIRCGGRHVTLFGGEPGKPAPRTVVSGAAATSSLADALITDMLPEQIVFGDRNGVAVLPIHSINRQSNFFADFRDPRVGRIVEEARKFSTVVMDLPVLRGSSDALALALHADAVVIVPTAGKTTTEDVGEALQQFRRAGANVIGTVIIKAANA